MGKDPKDVGETAADDEAAVDVVPDVAGEPEALPGYPDSVDEVPEEQGSPPPDVDPEVQQRMTRAEGEEPEEDAPPPRPINVPSLEELKAAGRKAATLDARIARALPFPLETLGYEVMVAPTHGMDMYEKLFARGNEFFQTQEGMMSVDFAFVKMVVLNCVVEPVLDDEALEIIIEADANEFGMLSAFCQQISNVDGLEATAIRLGEISTEAQEVFFEAMLPSTKSPTPASAI